MMCAWVSQECAGSFRRGARVLKSGGAQVGASAPTAGCGLISLARNLQLRES
jgi:hypothetical protein